MDRNHLKDMRERLNRYRARNAALVGSIVVVPLR